MSRRDRIEIIEAWLAEGPAVAPHRLVEELPARLAVTRQARAVTILRRPFVLAPMVAAAIVVAAVVLSSLLRPPAGDDRPTAIPSPPTPFATGDRADIVLLVENRSGRPYGPWYWSGFSGSGPTVSPCAANLSAYRIRAPGLVHFGLADPEADVPARESLPVILSTDALPGSPVAFRDGSVPVWTFAYRVTVSEHEQVTVEPLSQLPSVTAAGPLCPVPDTSWPGGWPDVRAWLSQQPDLPDCGLERSEQPLLEEPAFVPNTVARQCLYDAWLAGGRAQFVKLTYTVDGPFLEVTRTSDGTVERVVQQLRSTVSDQLRVTTCTRLVPPSQLPGVAPSAIDDAVWVFSVDAESCS